MDLIRKSILLVLNFFRIKLNEETVDLLVQIFKFCMVGVVSTGIDFLFLYLFKEICNLPVILSNTLSFSFSVLYNYWASLTFVFRVNQEKSKKRNFVIFILCSLIGLVFNDFIVWLITDFMKVYYMISKVIATVIVMVFNFVTRKKFLE